VAESTAEKASSPTEAGRVLNNHEEDPMTTYRQLTLDERYQIQSLIRLGVSQAEIARQLGRHPSTIARECRRNQAHQVYVAERAHNQAKRRRAQTGAGRRKIRGALQELVEAKLRLGWSPEQISGRLQMEGPTTLSFETIYQHVLRDETGLRYCLRFGGYKPYDARFKKSKCAELTRGWRKLLDERPTGANERTELGHWERDLVEGPRSASGALLTIVDRKSRFTCVRFVPSKHADVVAEITMEALAPHKAMTKTLTNDNGREFQRGKQFEERFGIPVFYTAPSSPWQRGTVENTNGLVRQYFRKGMDPAKAKDWYPRAIEETLNHRPRKTLGYRTPYEVVFDEKTALMNSQSQFGLEFRSSS
jgi:IS30 family transposase